MNVLIIFARAPVEGKVKTRLEKDTTLSRKEVCALYSSFLLDVFTIAANNKADKILVNFSPAEMESEMREMAETKIPKEKLLMHPQKGGTFHERVAHGFRLASEAGAKVAVMIGSDSPTMRARIISEAFDSLNYRGGAVLGPSGEAGIYLIGLNKNYTPDFEKIFSSAGELSNFAKQLGWDGVPFWILEEVLDVDVASDLVSLVALVDVIKRAARDNAVDFPANTSKTLEEFGLRIERRGDTRDKVLVRAGQ